MFINHLIIKNINANSIRELNIYIDISRFLED